MKKLEERQTDLENKLSAQANKNAFLKQELEKGLINMNKLEGAHLLIVDLIKEDREDILASKKAIDKAVTDTVEVMNKQEKPDPKKKKGSKKK